MNRNLMPDRSEGRSAQPHYRRRAGNGSWLTLMKILFFACGFTILLGAWLSSRSHLTLPGAFDAVPGATLAQIDKTAGHPAARSTIGAPGIGASSSSAAAAAGAASSGVAAAPGAATPGRLAPNSRVAAAGDRRTAPSDVHGAGVSTAPTASGAEAVPDGQMPPRPIRTATTDPSTPGATPAETALPAVPPAAAQPAQEWGIEVASLRLTAGGNALDLRYKVVDPGKSARVLRDGGPSYILDDAGRRISPRNVQGIGDYYAARHLDQPGRVYSTWFANQGASLKSGDLVSVVMGDLRVANVRVE